MALNYGPIIPGYVNGLTFYIDAIKPQSYPGTGTSWFNMIKDAPECLLVNGPTFNNTPPSTNFSFDGSNDYVQINGGNYAITLGDGNSPWTVSAWVKSTTTVNDLGAGSILSNSNGGPVYSMMGINGGKIVYWVYPSNINSWKSFKGNITVNDGNWHLLTWVQNVGYSMDMYVDGIYDITASPTNAGNNNPVDRIGGSWAVVYNGSIATLSIYKGTALTAAQVLQNYNATKTRFGL